MIDFVVFLMFGKVVLKVIDLCKIMQLVFWTHSLAAILDFCKIMQPVFWI